MTSKCAWICRHVVERHVLGLGRLVDQHRMALREGAAAGILAAQPHRRALGQQRAPGQRLAGRPVDILAGLDGLALLLEQARNLAIEVEVLGRLGNGAADRQELVELDGGGALAVLLARRDREAGPAALQPVGLVGLVLGRRLERLVELLAQLRVEGRDVGRRHDAFGFQARGIDFFHRLVAGDHLVHQRLGEHRLVRLVVAVPSVAEHVDDDVALEALAELGGDARDVDHGFGIVAVHVQDRRLHDLGDLRAVRPRARIGRQGGEADLVVDDEMDGAADAVAAEIREIEALGHQPLAGEGRVAVHQDGHDLAALGVAALVLLGARLAQHHGIDGFEMRGIGRQRDMDGGAVELAVGRGAEMVFHVARAAHFLGLRGAALELGEQRGVALVQDMHEGVQPAAMRHADHHVADAELGAALQDLLDAGDHRFAAVQAEALGADEFHAEITLQPLRRDDALEDRAAALDGELGAVLDMLDALLDPRLLVGIGDVHVLHADLAAVGLAQAVHDLPQRGGFAQAQRAEDQDRDDPSRPRRSRRSRDRARGAAPGAPGPADRGRLRDGRGCGRSGSAGTPVRCPGRRRGCLPRSCRRSRPAAAAPLPFTLRLAAGGRLSGSTAPMTCAPLGAHDAPRTSASTSLFCSPSASKKVRHSASTAFGSPR